MEKLADAGNGVYAYVDRIEEARRIFVEDLVGTLHTVAQEARSQVAFDPEKVRSYRLLGYENRDIADKDFRNDAVDAGEIGSGHAVTALYELELIDGAEGVLGSVSLRWRERGSEASFVEIQEGIEGKHLADSAGSPHFRLASLVARFAEWLRAPEEALAFSPATLVPEAKALAGELDKDQAVSELAELIQRTADLAPPTLAPR
jgi:Ca-activated chloride channel family protein